jgi:hypothetical protein
MADGEAPQLFHTIGDVRAMCLTDKQAAMLQAASPIALFEGGVGSGKTTAGAAALVDRCLANPPSVTGLVVAPYYKLLFDPVIKKIREVLDFFEVPHELSEQKMAMRVGPPGDQRTILFRSADNPDNLSAINAGYGWMDEAALCSVEAWERFSQRIRDPSATLTQRILTTTPEGTHTWVEALKLAASKQQPNPLTVVNASSMDNPALTGAYMESLKLLYADDPDGWRQYVEGVATDARGAIYRVNAGTALAFDRRLLQSGEVVVGWDFNWGWMVTVICVWLPSYGTLHVIGEVVSRDPGGIDTADHAQRVVEQLQRMGLIMPGHPRGLMYQANKPVEIRAYVDASGANRSASSYTTCEAAVRKAGFLVRTEGSNPAVRNRIAAVNRALKTRQLLVDPVGAPEMLQALKSHVRDKHGEPRKNWGPKDFQADHYCDALGYAVWGLMPFRPESWGVF